MQQRKDYCLYLNYSMREKGMKNKLCIAVLLLASSSVQADWELISTPDSYDYYFDPQTIRVQGNYTTVWTMSNYRNPEPDPAGAGLYNSDKTLKVLDCAGYMAGTRTIVAYSEPMGAGKVVFNSSFFSSISSVGLTDVVPGTVLDKLFTTVCNR